jgi:hypothetical protein
MRGIPFGVAGVVLMHIGNIASNDLSVIPVTAAIICAAVCMERLLR